MADHKQFYRAEHKQLNSSRDFIYIPVFRLQLPNYKRIFKMAQVKLVWLICDMFGIPLTILGIIANLDNIKSAIIAILAIAYLMVSAYYRFRRMAQNDREKELDLWHKEQDKIDRINKNK